MMGSLLALPHATASSQQGASSYDTKVARHLRGQSAARTSSWVTTVYTLRMSNAHLAMLLHDRQGRAITSLVPANVLIGAWVAFGPMTRDPVAKASSTLL